MIKKKHKPRPLSQRRQGPSKKGLGNANSARQSDGWRTFLQLKCKGISLTLGLPFAMVLSMLVLVHADWSKVGAHIDAPAFLGGSISTVVLGALRKIWKG